MNLQGNAIVSSNVPLTLILRREATSTNKKIVEILERFQNPGLIHAFWENDPSKNDEIFYCLVRCYESDLARDFYEEVQEVDVFYENDGATILDLLMILASHHPKIYTYLERFFDKNPYIDLTSSHKENRIPLPSNLQLLVMANQVNLVHKILNAYMERGLEHDIAIATSLFEAIVDHLENFDFRNHSPIFNEDTTDKDLWRAYLYLIEDYYKRPFRKIPATLDERVLLASKGILPRELSQIIKRYVILAEYPSASLCPEKLLNAKSVISEEEALKKRSFTPLEEKKLAILCFQALKESSGIILSNEQKNLSLSLLRKEVRERTILYYSDAKQRIVEEFSKLKSFSKSDIEAALNRA